jgi:hypothetical protein
VTTNKTLKRRQDPDPSISLSNRIEKILRGKEKDELLEKFSKASYLEYTIYLAPHI